MVRLSFGGRHFGERGQPDANLAAQFDAMTSKSQAGVKSDYDTRPSGSDT